MLCMTYLLVVCVNKSAVHEGTIICQTRVPHSTISSEMKHLPRTHLKSFERIQAFWAYPAGGGHKCLLSMVTSVSE